jgi:hypothetical protein
VVGVGYNNGFSWFETRALVLRMLRTIFMEKARLRKERI